MSSEFYDRRLKKRKILRSSEEENAFMSDRINEWLRIEMPSIEIKKPLTVHLDELLNRKVEQFDWVSLSCKAYEVLLNRMQSIINGYMPLLIIPLSPMENLDIAYPESSTLLKNVHNCQSPSIGIIDRNCAKCLWPQEEHVYPIELNLFGHKSDSIYISYRIYKSIEGISNNWEYNRHILVEHYPEEYKF